MGTDFWPTLYKQLVQLNQPIKNEFSVTLVCVFMEGNIVPGKNNGG